MTTKSVFEAALKLPKKDKLRLAKKLRDSADHDEMLMNAANEAERRIEAYDRGEMTASPAEEVIQRLLKRKLTKK